MKHKNIYRISISLLLAFVMALPTIAQNTKTFKGVVLDETEQPIIGAAIKVVGTTVGTITDLDGNFTLNVPDGKEVEISYIGYVPQRFSAPFKLTKIILKEDTQQLDEVVVVGYGTQKKAHLTGAIATVPVDDIQDISSGSLASTLSGLANGISVTEVILVRDKTLRLLFVRMVSWKKWEVPTCSHCMLLMVTFILRK